MKAHNTQASKEITFRKQKYKIFQIHKALPQNFKSKKQLLRKGNFSGPAERCKQNSRITTFVQSSVIWDIKMLLKVTPMFL